MPFSHDIFPGLVKSGMIPYQVRPIVQRYGVGWGRDRSVGICDAHSTSWSIMGLLAYHYAYTVCNETIAATCYESPLSLFWCIYPFIDVRFRFVVADCCEWQCIHCVSRPLAAATRHSSLLRASTFRPTIRRLFIVDDFPSFRLLKCSHLLLQPVLIWMLA